MAEVVGELRGDCCSQLPQTHEHHIIISGLVCKIDSSPPALSAQVELLGFVLITVLVCLGLHFLLRGKGNVPLGRNSLAPETRLRDVCKE